MKFQNKNNNNKAMYSFDYDERIKKYYSSFVSVTIDEVYAQKISNLAERIAEEKNNEKHHKIDGRYEFERWNTGLMGEAALEKLFQMHIIEWETGPSEQFLHPDIPQYMVGIKSSSEGNAPLIDKKNQYPQIICIVAKRNVYVCGLASVDVLNNNGNIDAVKSNGVKRRGVKTAFDGFEHLIPVNSIEDIKEYRISKD